MGCLSHLCDLRVWVFCLTLNIMPVSLCLQVTHANLTTILQISSWMFWMVILQRWKLQKVNMTTFNLWALTSWMCYLTPFVQDICATSINGLKVNTRREIHPTKQTIGKQTIRVFPCRVLAKSRTLPEIKKNYLLAGESNSDSCMMIRHANHYTRHNLQDTFKC